MKPLILNVNHNYFENMNQAGKHFSTFPKAMMWRIFVVHYVKENRFMKPSLCKILII